MIRNCFCLLLLLCFVVGCTAKQGSSSTPAESTAGVDSLKYAVGYEITSFDGYTQVEVKDPWNKGKLLQRYLLVPREAELPEDLPKGTLIRTPIRNIVVYTSVHCSVLVTLGALDNIVGVCESRYIDIPEIQEGIQNGTLVDLGEATAPNIEKMIEIGTEVVLASPFDHGSYGPVEKMGIPVIECADYMETNPLGRAEWMKFIGLLTGKSERADTLFRKTECNYLRIKEIAKDVAYRPTLFTGKKFGAPWHVPAGESYMANIYKDAGADYIFKYLPGTGGTPLNYEAVLDKAIHADFWLIQYNDANDMSYASLESEYAPYNQFDAFKKRRVYGCNTRYTSYYEDVPMHPDYLLEELIALFHPELIGGHQFRFYKPLGK